MAEEGIVSDDTKNTAAKPNPKLTLLPLIALIFYEVSGGPFGVEDSVRAGGGPLLSLLGFLVFPLFWSIPEALVTAELATSFPENGGYVLWISAAFGPFWGFQEGFWKWFSGVMDNALYPVLFLDYLKHSFPIFNRLIARIPALLGITFSLTYLNYRGLHIVGFSAVSLAIFSLCPFLVMAILSIPRIRVKQWLVVDFKKVDWRGYFNSMFWNLNYWDKASTLAGEVENPSKTFPKALLGAVVVVVSSYLIPLLAGTGALNSASSEWTDGYFAEVGMLIGGFWLKWWIQAAAAMSNMGLFEAEMSSDAFQLLGMSEMGMLPAIFASRSKYGTPTVSILCSATGVIFLSWMSFQEILEFLNFLYAIGMLLEFAAFIKLRVKKPDLHRPYKVPFQTFGATMLCLPPALLLVLVMCLASLRTYFVSGCVIIVGVLLYPLLVHAKDRKWAHFDAEQPAEPPLNCPAGHSSASQLHPEDADEASVGLLTDLSPGAGLGVLNMAVQAVARMAGNGEAAAKYHFFLIDKDGLVTKERQNLDPMAAPFAKEPGAIDGLREGASLVEVVKKVKPHVLLGLSGVGGVFSQEVLQAMRESDSAKPAIFAMSNPTMNAECTAEDAFKHAGENIVFGSGSPFDNVDLGNGKVGHVNQANNMYLFPGIGLGALLAGARLISDGMLQAASECLASYITDEDIQKGILYPSIHSIRHLTVEVGAAVLRAAVAEELAEGHCDVGPKELMNMSKEETLEYVTRNMWFPVYSPLVHEK